MSASFLGESPVIVIPQICISSVGDPERFEARDLRCSELDLSHALILSQALIGRRLGEVNLSQALISGALLGKEPSIEEEANEGGAVMGTWTNGPPRI